MQIKNNTTTLNAQKSEVSASHKYNNIELSAKIKGKDIDLADAASIAHSIGRDGFTYGNVSSLAGSVAALIPGAGVLLGPAISGLGNLFSGNTARKSPISQLSSKLDFKFAEINKNILKSTAEIKKEISDTKETVEKTAKETEENIILNLSNAIKNNKEEEQYYQSLAAKKIESFVDKELLNIKKQTTEKINAINLETIKKNKELVTNAYKTQEKDFNLFQKEELKKIGSTLLSILPKKGKNKIKNKKLKHDYFVYIILLLVIYFLLNKS